MLFKHLKFSIFVILLTSCASQKSSILDKSADFELKPKSYNSIGLVINITGYPKSFTPFGIAQKNYTLDTEGFINAIEQGFVRSHLGSKEKVQFFHYDPNSESWVDKLRNHKFDIVYHLGKVDVSLSEKWTGQGMYRSRVGIFFQSLFHLEVYEELQKKMTIRLKHESPASSEVSVALETNLFMSINHFSEKELNYHKFFGTISDNMNQIQLQ